SYAGFAPGIVGRPSAHLQRPGGARRGTGKAGDARASRARDRRIRAGVALIHPRPESKTRRQKMQQHDKSRAWGRWTAAAALLAVSALASAQTLPAPPAPGQSPRIDAIRKSGQLRVGVLQNAPWLIQNTSGSGEAWSGPAWMLA